MLVIRHIRNNYRFFLLSTIAMLVFSHPLAYATQGFTLEEFAFTCFAQRGAFEEEDIGDGDKVYYCRGQNGKPLKILGVTDFTSDDIQDDKTICIPEPSSIFGLMVIGSIFAGNKILKKRKQLH